MDLGGAHWGTQELTREPEEETGSRPLSRMLSGSKVMAQVLIRQLDDHVVAALGARAQAQGLSLEQSLCDLLTATARHSDALRHQLTQLRATTPSAGCQLNVAALVRDDRDGR